jgi:hypothetical protein
MWIGPGVLILGALHPASVLMSVQIWFLGHLRGSTLSPSSAEAEYRGVTNAVAESR